MKTRRPVSVVIGESWVFDDDWLTTGGRTLACTDVVRAREPSLGESPMSSKPLATDLDDSGRSLSLLSGSRPGQRMSRPRPTVAAPKGERKGMTRVVCSIHTAARALDRERLFVVRGCSLCCKCEMRSIPLIQVCGVCSAVFLMCMLHVSNASFSESHRIRHTVSSKLGPVLVPPRFYPR